VQWTQKQSPIGIDISRGRVKMVQFRRRGAGVGLLAAGSLDVALRGNDNDDGDRQDTVRQLKKALLRRKFGARRAVLSLPPPETDVRPLTLPADAHDLTKMIRWEVESYVDYPVDEAIVDHVVLGEAKSAGERRLEVLAATARQCRVVAICDLLARAGLMVEAVDIVPLALGRLVDAIEAGPGDATAAVDIGAQSTHAVIIDDHELRMSRTIGLGGDTFTEAITLALEISTKEAEVLKAQHGTGRVDAEPAEADESGKIARIVNDILRNKLDLLATELAKLFRYFSAQNQGRAVGRVVLLGGGGALKHLDEFLTERLSTPVEVGRPLCGVTGDEPDLPDSAEGAYAVAAGLALREA
jgi:type IV pilus assembly protein PilM